MYMLKNNAAFIVLPKNSKFLILGSSAQAFCSNTNLGDNSLHPLLPFYAFVQKLYQLQHKIGSTKNQNYEVLAANSIFVSLI